MRIATISAWIADARDLVESFRKGVRYGRRLDALSRRAVKQERLLFRAMEQQALTFLALGGGCSIP